MLQNRRETCKACWRVSAVGFDVPDELWHKVVPEQLADKVLCLACFTHFADQHLADWSGQIQFFPVSLYECLFCDASMAQCSGSHLEVGELSVNLSEPHGVGPDPSDLMESAS